MKSKHDSNTDVSGTSNSAAAPAEEPEVLSLTWKRLIPNQIAEEEDPASRKMQALASTGKTRSRPSSFIKGINQLCIVTNDLEKTTQELTERFRIGPFKCWHYKPPVLFNTKFRGKEVLWTLKLAIAWVGSMQWEIVQPLEGPSLYKEYLNAHGEENNRTFCYKAVLRFAAKNLCCRCS